MNDKFLKVLMKYLCLHFKKKFIQNKKLVTS